MLRTGGMRPDHLIDHERDHGPPLLYQPTGLGPCYNDQGRYETNLVLIHSYVYPLQCLWNRTSPRDGSRLAAGCQPFHPFYKPWHPRWALPVLTRSEVQEPPHLSPVRKIGDASTNFPCTMNATCFSWLAQPCILKGTILGQADFTRVILAIWAREYCSQMITGGILSIVLISRAEPGTST